MNKKKEGMELGKQCREKKNAEKRREITRIDKRGREMKDMNNGGRKVEQEWRNESWEPRRGSHNGEAVMGDGRHEWREEWERRKEGKGEGRTERHQEGGQVEETR